GLRGLLPALRVRRGAAGRRQPAIPRSGGLGTAGLPPGLAEIARGGSGVRLTALPGIERLCLDHPLRVQVLYPGGPLGDRRPIPPPWALPRADGGSSRDQPCALL